ncbi:16820_t:CDS:2 [Dentiscutata erythropus]|uniref:16820_t:CDS:1 n=1 Tax=Dentiscutata erythropus TaxID=1348616 RepID=A0A9N9BI32_9GLOM|nr:16820_t:CDS:2 [Dentiscutata erythropus]
MVRIIKEIWTFLKNVVVFGCEFVIPASLPFFFPFLFLYPGICELSYVIYPYLSTFYVIVFLPLGNSFLKLREMSLIHKRIIRLYPIFCVFFVLIILAMFAGLYFGLPFLYSYVPYSMVLLTRSNSVFVIHWLIRIAWYLFLYNVPNGNIFPSAICSDMAFLCPKCTKKRNYPTWCQDCASQHFLSNYEHWTSGDQIVDQVIKYTQENSKSPIDFVEWIPYEQLEKRESIGQDKYGSVYSAFLKSGPILMYNNKFKKTKGIQIALRRLKDDTFNESLRGVIIMLILVNELLLYSYINNNEFRECENISSISQNLQEITQEIELVIKRDTIKRNRPKLLPLSKDIEHSSGKNSSHTAIGPIQN